MAVIVGDRRSPTPGFFQAFAALLSRKDNRSIPVDRSGYTATASVSPHYRDYHSYLEAYKLPWVNACVKVIAYNCANVEYHLADPTVNEGERKEVTNSPLITLLKKPNPFQTGFQLFELITTDLELTGNAFMSLEAMNGLRQPGELYRLRPDNMIVVPDPARGVSGYRYAVNGKQVEYEVDEMIHFKYPNPMDDLYGLGTIEAGEARFDSDRSMNEHERKFWRSGAKITGILSTDSAVPDGTWERLKGNIRRYFEGSGFDTMMLENGLKYQSVSDGPAKLGMLDMAKASRDMILAMFGVPPTKLGILENANYKAQASDEFFWSETIDPKLTRREQDLQTLVERFHPGQGLGIIYDRLNFSDDLPSATVAELQAKTYSKTINEIREYQGMNKLPKNGDVILVPTGYQTYDPKTGEISPTGTADPPPPPDPPVPPASTPPMPEGQMMPPGQTPPAGQVPGVTPPNSVPVDPVTGGAAKRVIRTSANRPATAGVLRKDYLKAQESGVRKHTPKLKTFFGAQEQRVKAKLMTFKKRKAAITTDALWDDDNEDAELGDTLEPVHADGMAKAYATVNRIGLNVDFDLGNERLAAFSGKLAKRVTNINSTTRDAIDGVVNEGLRRGYSVLQIADGNPDENYDGITGVFESAKGYRAEMIARTETMAAYNGATLVAYKDSDMVSQVEALDGEDDPECSERNGQTYDLDEAEDVLGEEHPNGTLAFVPVVDWGDGSEADDLSDELDAAGISRAPDIKAIRTDLAKAVLLFSEVVNDELDTGAA